MEDQTQGNGAQNPVDVDGWKAGSLRPESMEEPEPKRIKTEPSEVDGLDHREETPEGLPETLLEDYRADPDRSFNEHLAAIALEPAWLEDMDGDLARRFARAWFVFRDANINGSEDGRGLAPGDLEFIDWILNERGLRAREFVGKDLESRETDDESHDEEELGSLDESIDENNDEGEPARQSILEKLDGDQSLNSTEIDLLARHVIWYTVMDPRQLTALAESRAMRIEMPTPHSQIASNEEYENLDHCLKQHANLDSLITAAKMVRQLLNRSRADKPTPDGRESKTMEPESSTHDRSRADPMQQRLLLPQEMGPVTLSRVQATTISGKLNALHVRALDWEPVSDMLGANEPIKADITTCLERVSADLIDEVKQVALQLQPTAPEPDLDLKTTIMQRVPTHVARMVGALSPDQEGDVNLTEKWKKLRPLFPLNSQTLWDRVDSMLPILNDVRMWIPATSFLQEIYRSPIIADQITLRDTLVSELGTSENSNHGS